MEIDEKTYQETLKKIKEKLNKAAREGVLLSYKDLGSILDLDPEYVREIVGRRFTELTKQATKSWFESPNPDFFLIGENIKEINENKYYKFFKKRLSAKEKGSGILARLMRGF